MIPAVLLVVLQASAASATTVAGGTTSISLSGGVELYGPERYGYPVVPAPVLRAELAAGLSDRFNLRLEYSTLLGLVHRVDAAARVAVAGGGGWTLSAELRPSVGLFWMPRGLSGGDYAVTGELLFAARTPLGLAGVHASGTVVLRTWTDTGSKVWRDNRWRFDEIEVGVRLESRRHSFIRFDLAVPTFNADDAISLGGTYPKLTFGHAW